MSLTLVFTWDSASLDIWRGGGEVEKGLARRLRLAGNQAIRVMQRESITRIRNRKYLREGEVKDGLPIILPGSKQEVADLFWRMNVSGAPIPLYRYPHVVTAHGVTVRVNVGKGSREVRHAFIASMRSGHTGIFVRRGKARLPVDELYSSRLSDTMRDDALIAGVQAKASKRLQDAFTRGMTLEMAKLRHRGVI